MIQKKSIRFACVSMFFLFMGNLAMAQQFDVPSNVKLEAKEDYTLYEKDIIAATNWLEITPVGQDDQKRKEVSSFVLQWITGSPTVNIDINTPVGKLTEKNPDLLLMFMAGYSRFVLENNYEKDKFKCQVAAVKSVVNLYNLGGSLKKNKFVQKAVDADKQGTLENWVRQNLGQ